MIGKLSSFSFANFGSFAEEVTFRTTANSAQKEYLEENTFVEGDNSYNRVSFIYGANGSGKTTFCEALLQFQRILIMSPIYASNNPQLFEIAPDKGKFQKVDTFMFDKKYSDLPTTFKIEIIMDKILYAYSYAVQGEKIISEKLTKKYRRTETIMERTSPDFKSIILKSELKGFESNVSVVKENALCLSMAAFLNNELANKLHSEIISFRVINMAQYKNLTTINEKNCSPDKIQEYLEILKIADPTLKDIHVSINEKEVNRQSLNGPDFENRELIVKSVKVDVMSYHKTYENGIEIESEGLPFLKFESMGTIKLFGILPVIFEVLHAGGVIIIDEIENGLHPKLLELLVNLFQDKRTNPKNAQLVCTTHASSLTDIGVRRDQVWIASKDERGFSKMQCLGNLQGIRANSKNIENYLKDAFGSIPANLFDRLKIKKEPI